MSSLGLGKGCCSAWMCPSPQLRATGMWLVGCCKSISHGRSQIRSGQASTRPACAVWPAYEPFRGCLGLPKEALTGFA